MDYYFNVNGGSPFNQPNMPFLKTPESEKMKKGLFKNAAFLGILLLSYNLLNKIFVNVFYLACYTVFHGGVTLSTNTAKQYLANEKYSLVTSSSFSMTANVVVVVMSVLVLFLIADKFMDIDAASMLRGRKGLVKEGVLWSPACITVNLFLSVITAMFVRTMSESGVTVPEADFTIDKPSVYSIVIQVVYVCIVGPVIEEYIYRGLVIKLLSPYGKGMAVFFSALIFGLMHGNIPQAASAFGGGLIYAMVAVYFDSIVPTIAIHVANNIFASVTDIGEAAGISYTSEIYSVLLIAVMFAGMYGIIVKIKPTIHEIKVSQPAYALPASKRFSGVALNIFMIVYFVMLLWQYVESFISSNS